MNFIKNDWSKINHLSHEQNLKIIQKAEFRINSFAFVSTATEPADDAEVYMHCEV